MRPSKLTPLHVELISTAAAGGLSRAEIAAAVGISERTLYQWIASGKILYLLCWSGELSREDLDDLNQEKLRLYETLYPEPEKTPEEEIWEIQSLIDNKRVETDNTAHAREKRNAERQSKEKKRNAERSEERKWDRKTQKFIKRIKKEGHYFNIRVADLLMDVCKYTDPWKVRKHTDPWKISKHTDPWK